MKQETLQVALRAVRESSLLGILSTEITTTTGVANNRITAALSRLTELGCVRREKIYGYAGRFRYWYVRELDDSSTIDVPVTRRDDAPPVKVPMPKVEPRAPRTRWGVDASGVSIRLAIGARGSIAVTPEQAREVYKQLSVIFGG